MFGKMRGEGGPPSTRQAERRPPSTPDSVSGHRNGARRPLLSHLRRFCLRRHGLLPLPHGRGDDREPGPQTSGEPGGWASHPEITPGEAHWPARRLGACRRAPGAAAGRDPPSSLILASPTCALLCTTRAGHLPPHAASRSPCRKGSAPHKRTHALTLAGVGSRREQGFCRSTPDTERTRRTVAASRGAERNVPCRPPHRPPLSAPVHTSNQQRRRARRAEVSSVAGSAAADSSPSNKSEA